MVQYQWNNTSGSPADWTTAAKWDLNNGTYPDGVDDEAIFPAGKDPCHLNATQTIGEMTISGDDGAYDLDLQAALTVTGSLIFTTGVFNTMGEDLIVGTQMTMDNGATFNPSSSMVSIGSGNSLAGYALDMGLADAAGATITSGSGEWYMGSIRCNRAGNLFYMTSGNCYINGENTANNRKLEITAGECYHNKGLIYLYSPDDLEGGTPLSDNTIDIQWDGPSIEAGGDTGVYDLFVDIPYDSRDSPTGVLQTIGIRSDLIVEHYLYLYKGKFRNYSADVSAAKQLTVSGCTQMMCISDVAGGFFGRDDPTFQGTATDSYSKHSVGILELHDTGTPIELGINARGQVGDPGANRDNTAQSATYAIVARGNAQVLMNEADVTLGNFEMAYNTVSGGSGNPYIKLSSGSTILKTKNWNSYAIWTTNLNDNLGNYNNTLTHQDKPCGVYHNSGTLILDSAETNNYCINSQNDYVNVTYAAMPENDDLRTGYGRRFHLYNFIISGGSTYKHYFSSYSGAPLIVHNDFEIQAGQTLSQTFASDIQPQSGMIDVKGVTNIYGTLDLEGTSDADFQTMLPIVATKPSIGPYYQGCWPRYNFNQVNIWDGGLFKAPGIGNTLSLSGGTDARIILSGSAYPDAAHFKYVDMDPAGSDEDERFIHNSGTLLFISAAGDRPRCQIGTPSGIYGAYNVIISGTTATSAYDMGGKHQWGTNNDFIISAVKSTGNVERSCDRYPDRAGGFGGDFIINSGDFQIDNPNLAVAVSGSTFLGSGAVLGGRRYYNDPSRWTGDLDVLGNITIGEGAIFYLPETGGNGDGVSLKGSWINNGGEVTF